MEGHYRRGRSRPSPSESENDLHAAAASADDGNHVQLRRSRPGVDCSAPAPQRIHANPDPCAHRTQLGDRTGVVTRLHGSMRRQMNNPVAIQLPAPINAPFSTESK